jgi:glycosyltransferase involved in cell wall biosynthesis
MLIGIDASRAFLNKRTGIEEYSYQVIKNLADKLNGHRVILYVRPEQNIDFNLPENWKIKIVGWTYLWTQLGLSLEMFFHPVDVLFIPAHVAPPIHPKNTFVTIHGLEYEFVPESYSFWARIYMRLCIKFSCRAAKKIIAVSENTKKDLMELYEVPENKIEVIYEGFSVCHSGPPAGGPESSRENKDSALDSRFRGNDKYLLFIGRLEERKNIIGIVKAFEMLKEKYNIPHKLILAGKPGYGYEKINYTLQTTNHKEDIILPGFVSEKEKWELLKNADVFLFPSFYEGFGLPILEAQSVGVPVVTSDNSSLEEVAENSGILINPHNLHEITEAAYKLISDDEFREHMIIKGHENVKRFSWEKCAEKVVEVLIEK